MEKKNGISDAYEWLEAIVFPLIALVIIFTFFFKLVGVSGSSMMNTLNDGDRVVLRNIYTPKQGDIVVISRNYENIDTNDDRSAQPIIKRVIAIGGQTVDITEDGTVVVDGVPLDEPYVDTEDRQNIGDVEFPVTVREGYIFVMGDNRNVSKDSRFSSIGEMGQINEKYVLGKAISRIFPFDEMKWL